MERGSCNWIEEYVTYLSCFDSEICYISRYRRLDGDDYDASYTNRRCDVRGVEHAEDMAGNENTERDNRASGQGGNGAAWS
jgi:hypothetical protein